MKRVKIGTMMFSLFTGLFLFTWCSGGTIDNNNDVTEEIGKEDVQVDITDKDVTTTETADEAIEETLVETVEEIQETVDPEDIIPEVEKDIEQEVVMMEEKMFHIDSMTLISPELCYPLGNQCMDINDMLNQYIAAYLDDDVDPMDIVAMFSDFIADGGPNDLTVASAKCERDDAGEVISCVADKPEPRFSTDLECIYGVDAPCGDTPAPCFRTKPGDFFLELDMLGIDLGMKSAELSGQFKGDFSAITEGKIKGFLPSAYAKTIEICPPVGEVQLDCVIMDKLFENAELVVLDGQEGWWMEFTFTASAVDFTMP